MSEIRNKMGRERPVFVHWFDRLFFGSLVISLIDLFYHWDLMFADFDDDQASRIEMAIIIVVIVIFGFGLQVLLWFFIAHRGSIVGKWTYIIFWGLGLLTLLFGEQEWMMSEIILSVVTQLTALVSIVLLFSADARLWFQTKGQISRGPDDGLSDVFR